MTQSDNDLTLHVRCTIIENAESIFSLLASYPEGRERLRHDLEMARARLNSRDEEERNYAVWMFWRTTKALDCHKPRKRSAKLEQIHDIALIAEGLLVPIIGQLDDSSAVREVCYRLRRIVELAERSGTRGHA